MSNWGHFNSFESQLSPALTDGSFSSGTSACSSPVPSPDDRFSDEQSPPALWCPQMGLKHEEALDLCNTGKSTTIDQENQQTRKNTRRRIHIPHSQRPRDFVVKRNARERRRVEAVNDAFHILQETVPTMRTRGSPQRLSKASILRGAIDYIQQLHMALGIPTENPEHEFYNNNHPEFYPANYQQSSDQGYQPFYSDVNSASSDDMRPSPTGNQTIFPQSHTTWSQPEKEQQPSVVDLLDAYWNNMNIDDIASNISFNDFEMDL